MKCGFLMAAALVCLVPDLVDSYCRTVTGETPDAPCVIDGLTVAEGETHIRAAPSCETCMCMATGLACCRPAFHLFRVPGCEHVDIPGSCRFNLRDVNDHFRPCRLK